MTKNGNKMTNKIGMEKIIPSFHMEADARGGNMSLLIASVIGVKAFSSDEATVITRKESITISGKELKIAVLESKTVEISGKIENITFILKRRYGRK